MGICHSDAPDGRCISLLKILLTNSCFFDCHYCINRKSSNVRRARFTVPEVVELRRLFTETVEQFDKATNPLVSRSAPAGFGRKVNNQGFGRI